MRRGKHVLWIGCFALAFAAPRVMAGEWPGWRGPSGQGRCEEKNLPLNWDGKSGKNILWKVELHGGRKKNPEFATPGWSSPIVWKDRVYITSAVHSEGLGEKERRVTIAEHHALCFDARDGKQIWDTIIPPGKCVVDNHFHGYATPTPVTDGEHIFAVYGSGVAVALDLQGKIVWREELPHPKDTDGGLCSSVVLVGDTVVFPSINDAGLRALEKKTGKLKWEQKTKDRNRLSTPGLFRIGQGTQLIHEAGGVQGLDPNTGEVLWFCRGIPGGQSSPIAAGDRIYVDPGRGNGICALVDATGKGDVTKTNIVWQTKVATAAASSGIVVGDFVYRASEPGKILCRQLADGELKYDERAQGISPSASPVSTADGRIYFASSQKTYVIKAGPEFEVLAVNELNDGPDYTSAAISNGRIFLRGKSYLWCISEK